MSPCCRAGSGSLAASPQASPHAVRTIGRTGSGAGEAAAPQPARSISRAGSGAGEPASPPLTRTASRAGSGAVSPTILDITESWLQGPAVMRQRLASEGGEGGDPSTPATRQLVDEAADMLSNLLASPDKVILPRLQVFARTRLESFGSTSMGTKPAGRQLVDDSSNIC